MEPKKPNSIYISTYDKFRCTGPSCLDTCCYNWNIPVDEQTYEKTVALSESTEEDASFAKELLNAIAQTEQKKYRMTLAEDKNCSMLNSDGLCRVHSALGHEYLSFTCRTYPRKVVNVNGFFECYLSMSCPEVCALTLFAKEGLSFETREGGDEAEQCVGIRDISNINTHIRNRSIFLLKDRSMPLWARLILMGFIFEELDSEGVRQGDAHAVDVIFDAYIENAPLLTLNPPTQSYDEHLIVIFISLEPIFKALCEADTISGRNAQLRELMREWSINMGKNGVDDLIRAKYKLFEPYIRKNEYVFENFLVSRLFGAGFPENSDSYIKSYFEFIVSYIILICTISSLFINKKSLEDDDITVAVMIFSKIAQHHPSFSKFTKEFVNKHPRMGLPHLAYMLRY